MASSTQNPKVPSSSKTNPNVVGGEGGIYAGYVAPERADQPVIAGRPGGFYGSDGQDPGNVVDTDRYAVQNATRTGPSGPGTSSKPLGQVTSRDDVLGDDPTGVAHTGY